ncbi:MULTISPECIES: LipL32 family surface lipoprotein [unclassified Pseudoalteromonas]|uniref:LipL32 family surface lipoprotein n=1 Tax=unclassified Pseudoalteromonas TaxID=194690 RepID=UPI0006942CC8|nr:MULTISPECIES: LipL32 family surface lipoprotein [unclassified Pseudoalteromonas]
MKKYKNLLLAGATFALCTGFFGGDDYNFKSSKSEGIGSFKVNLPYVKYEKYFGYVDTNIKPDGEYKNKDAYYLYLWVPAAIDELGVSMVSPAKDKPGKKDFVHSIFKKSMKKDKKAYFDTYLVLDKLDISDPKKIKNGGKVVKTLKTNDDSSELPKNPGGNKYNSILRHESKISSPTESLVRGVYRVSFTSFRGKVNGSYMATIGSNIPGVKVASSLEKLNKLVND